MMSMNLDHAFILNQWCAFATEVHVSKARIKRFVYVHSPYCTRKCKCCMYESDFGPTAAQISRQKNALIQEIKATAPAVRDMDFDGFYFGGGTPTIFSEQEFRDIMSAVRHLFTFSGRGMSTCEMHPYSATYEEMAIAAENGVDRISFGVQSLTPGVLQRAHRIPANADRINELIELAVQCGVKQINIDLLAPLPGETISSFIESVNSVLSCNPDSITLYNYQDERSSYFPENSNLPGLAWADIRNEFLQCTQAKKYSTAHGAEALVASVIVHKDFCHYNYDNNYELFSKSPMAVLGIGKYSQSNLFGKLFYYNSGPNNESTSYICNRYVGFSKSLYEEALDMILLHIRDRNPLDLSYFDDVFRFKPDDFIRKHFGELIDKGLLFLNETHFNSIMNFSDESQFLEFSELMKQKINLQGKSHIAKGLKDPRP